MSTKQPSGVPGKTSQKLSSKARKISEKADHLRATAEHQAAYLDRIASSLESLTVWTRDEPASRRPKLTRDELAAAAVRIADAEGFAALSMRRLAAELDVGTMSLYHYVRTKDELLTLVSDYVMGEVIMPAGETIPDDWREAMVMIATRSRDAMLRHLWVFDVADDPPLGPNAVRHFDESLQALASLDAPLDKRLEVLLAVDEYVFGYCFNYRNSAAGQADNEAMHTYLDNIVRGGGHPALERLVDELGFKGAWKRVEAVMGDHSRFERSLRKILDGLAA